MDVFKRIHEYECLDKNMIKQVTNSGHITGH